MNQTETITETDVDIDKSVLCEARIVKCDNKVEWMFLAECKVHGTMRTLYCEVHVTMCEKWRVQDHGLSCLKCGVYSLLMNYRYVKI